MTEESIKQQVKEARGWSYWAQAIDQEREVLALCDTVETLLRALQKPAMCMAASDIAYQVGNPWTKEEYIADYLESAQRIEEAKS